MADYHVFSSDNLTDWQDHGVIVSQEQVPWGKPDAYSMWAPDCVEKGGKSITSTSPMLRRADEALPLAWLLPTPPQVPSG